MASNKSTGFWAFIAGLGAGAALGILFAPDTGANTRDKLSYRAEKYYTRLKEMLNLMEKEAKNAKEHVSTKAKEDYRKAEELLGEVENLLDDIKGKARN